MKVFVFGGQKSGKSNFAEKKALEIALQKPFYIATYDNSYDDEQMQTRVLKHQNQRKENFITLEETKDLTKVIQKNNTYLVDCMSMWLFNNLEEDEDTLVKQLEEISKIDANIVFVLNEVNLGVIPIDKYSRKFVDLSGILGQKLASFCDEVYEIKFGLGNRLK